MALLFAGAFFIDTIVLLLTIVLSLKVYFQKAFTYWRSKGVPNLPPTFLFGNVHNTILQRQALGEVIADYYETFKSQGYRYCGFYFLSRPIFIITDIELLKTVVTKDFHHFTDRGIYSNEEVDPLTAHLLSLNGSKWKNMRAKLSPTFTSGKMKMMFNTLLDCSNELLVAMDKVVKSHEALDVKEILGRYTTDVIGSCGFGIECNSLKNPNSEFRHYGKKALGVSFIDCVRTTLSVFAPKIMKTFRLKAINSEVSNFFLNTVKETIRYREKNNVVRKDFMHLLIQLKNNIKIGDEDHVGELKSSHSNNEISLTEEQIAAEAFVFFVAGFETSSSTLTFCLYELALNPDIQEKLRNEVNEVFDKHKNQLSYEALIEMIYVDQCCNETFRKYPVAPVIGRVCTEEYKIPDSDVTIEKGTMVFLPIGGIHRDSEYYPNPERFDPERFTPENKSKLHHFAFLPFGEGPRICIGMRFGLIQIKVALSTLIKNYKFSLDNKTKQPLVIDPVSFVPAAKGGIWLNVEKI